MHGTVKRNICARRVRDIAEWWGKRSSIVCCTFSLIHRTGSLRFKVAFSGLCRRSLKAAYLKLVANVPMRCLPFV